MDAKGKRRQRDLDRLERRALHGDRRHAERLRPDREADRVAGLQVRTEAAKPEDGAVIDEILRRQHGFDEEGQADRDENAACSSLEVAADGRCRDMPAREVVREREGDPGRAVRAGGHLPEEEPVAEVVASAARVAAALGSRRERRLVGGVGAHDARPDGPVELCEQVQVGRGPDGEELLVDGAEDDRRRDRLAEAVDGSNRQGDRLAGPVALTVRRQRDRQRPLRALDGDTRMVGCRHIPPPGEPDPGDGRVGDLGLREPAGEGG